MPTWNAAANKKGLNAMRCYVAANSPFIREQLAEFPANLGIMSTTRTGNKTLDIARLGCKWTVDNGFFSRPDPQRFKTLCCNVRGLPGLQWVAVPDVVGSADLTIKSWNAWSPWMKELQLPLAFVLQDGIRLWQCPPADCYFIGGSTDFKLSGEVATLVQQLKKTGASIHMGRVNTLDRLQYAHSIGCDSFDGSSVARWSRTYLRWFCKWCRYLDQLETTRFSGRDVINGEA